MLSNIILVRKLGLLNWEITSDAMHLFTNQRNEYSNDELWLVEHPPIFTQGKSCKKNNLFMLNNIPIVHSDRGGQTTYHGPGQQIMYVLIDIKRRKLNVSKLVLLLEKTVITTLQYYGINSYSYPEAPGVYVNKKKICSLGLRIQKGCSLHGLAVNVAMDLNPFLSINPCGYVGMQMTQLSEFKPEITVKEVGFKLADVFARLAGYEKITYLT
ncbi:lipoyl(octanoyl) transferase LipB [Candidatus Ishikawella capsulata]|uniref:Octanoyltransferase n=1 Tax=Candidatus Ishikawaella capsulata Mpkobe TaxID=476281 RepID=C5WDE9_9ENTR|nr:lipoyl(octanoyl) transferase LipB [Candidatus Ishikawaella capsulata]BAH83355.1 lipoyltransferase [Candidatus Ishikawaella capsulata Mpkobe]